MNRIDESKRKMINSVNEQIMPIEVIPFLKALAEGEKQEDYLWLMLKAFVLGTIYKK